MRVKEESEKADLKLNIQKTKITASSPITSWQIDGGKSRRSDRFYFWGIQNHYSDRSHEIKRCLVLEMKAMTNLDRILKNREITLLTRV